MKYLLASRAYVRRVTFAKPCKNVVPVRKSSGIDAAPANKIVEQHVLSGPVELQGYLLRSALEPVECVAPSLTSAGRPLRHYGMIEVGLSLRQILALDLHGGHEESDVHLLDPIKLYGQVRALSAEGRLSAWVLMALPPGMLLVELFLNPSYAGRLLHTPTGRMMLWGAVILQLLGLLVIRKIIRIKV